MFSALTHTFIAVVLFSIIKVQCTLCFNYKERGEAAKIRSKSLKKLVWAAESGYKTRKEEYRKKTGEIKTPDPVFCDYGDVFIGSEFSRFQTSKDDAYLRFFIPGILLYGSLCSSFNLA